MHIHFNCSRYCIYFSFQIGELLVPKNIVCVFAFVFVLLSLSMSLYCRLFILPQIFVRRIAVPRELGPSLALGGSHCLLSRTFFTSPTTTSALGTLMVIHLSLSLYFVSLPPTTALLVFIMLFYLCDNPVVFELVFVFVFVVVPVLYIS